MKDTVDSCK